MLVQLEADLGTYIFSKYVKSEHMKADELSRAFEYSGNPVPAFIRKRLSGRQASRLKRVYPECERMIQRVNALGGTLAKPLPGSRPSTTGYAAGYAAGVEGKGGNH